MKKNKKYIAKLTALLLSALLIAAVPVYAAEEQAAAGQAAENTDPGRAEIIPEEAEAEEIVPGGAETEEIVPGEAEAETVIPEEAEAEEIIPEGTGTEEAAAEETVRTEETYEDAEPAKTDEEEPETEQAVPEEEEPAEEEPAKDARLMAEEYVTITALNRQDNYNYGDVLFEEGYRYPTDTRELRISGSGTSSSNITIQSIEWLKLNESTGEYVADTSSDPVFSAGSWKCILTLNGVSSANINDAATGRGRIHFAGFPEGTIWQGNGNSNGNIPFYTYFGIEGTEILESITLHGDSPEELTVGDQLPELSFTLDPELVSKGISITDACWLREPEDPWGMEWYEYPEALPGEAVELGKYYLAVNLTNSNESCQLSDEIYVADDGWGVYLSIHRESDTSILVANEYEIKADEDGIVYRLSEDYEDAVVAEDSFTYLLDKNLVIPGEVTFGSRTYAVKEIDGAFSDAIIESVTIPASVEYVGKYSFDNCTELKKVIFEEGSRCTRIADCVFRDCEALTSLRLSRSLRTIGDSAFYNCRSLESIRIPASVKKLRPNVFERCSALSKVIFSEGSCLESIGDKAFGHNTGKNPLVIRYYEDDTDAKNVIESYVSWARGVGWTYISTNPYPSKYVSIKDCTVAPIEGRVYTGSPRKPALTITYKGKTLKAGVDYKATYSNNINVGKAKVTIKGLGTFKDTTSRTFRINPKGTTIKSLEAYSKAVKVKWNVQSEKMSKTRITGYQIQLATNSAFTQNKKTVTAEGYKRASQKVTGLKGGKKYYVHIRTCKVVDGRTYYSSWSKAKTVTVKK